MGKFDCDRCGQPLHQGNAHTEQDCTQALQFRVLETEGALDAAVDLILRLVRIAEPQEAAVLKGVYQDFWNNWGYDDLLWRVEW